MGITEARGRLMERNGEDYICPNCTAKKNQVVKPATAGKLKGDAGSLTSTPAVSAEKTNGSQSAVQAVPSSSSTGSEDMGIKGRIEKATNPTGKKKIKIFQPVGSLNSFEMIVTPAIESFYCHLIRHGACHNVNVKMTLMSWLIISAITSSYSDITFPVKNLKCVGEI